MVPFTVVAVRAREGPDEARGLAGGDRDAAFMRLHRHGVRMPALLLLLHHRLHHLSMLGVRRPGADQELVRVEPVVAHDEAHRLAVLHLQRLQREFVVARHDFDDARDLARVTGLAVAHLMVGAVRRRLCGRSQRKDADD
jgi:hypothetical protein